MVQVVRRAKCGVTQSGLVLDHSVIYQDCYGLWARVDAKLWVSSTGWSWEKGKVPNKPLPHPFTGDVMVKYKKKNHRMHVLMATSFFGTASDDHIVEHLDKHHGDIIKSRSDNRIENLRWVQKLTFKKDTSEFRGTYVDTDRLEGLRHLARAQTPP